MTKMSRKAVSRTFLLGMAFLISACRAEPASSVHAARDDAGAGVAPSVSAGTTGVALAARSQALAILIDGHQVASVALADFVQRRLLRELAGGDAESATSPWLGVHAFTDDGRTLRLPKPAETYPGDELFVFVHAELGTSVGLFPRGASQGAQPAVFLAGRIPRGYTSNRAACSGIAGPCYRCGRARSGGEW